MSKKNKVVMIVENSNSSLNFVNKNEYILEGVFAEFGRENKNSRIYEENEYLPHLEYLKEKIKAKALIGELDHPDKFEVSVKNASHIIEDLYYVPEKRQLWGRIRLLNTDAGKIARALVDDGVQLSISSRAAGIVKENKKVEIKKIFTYDIVADPGFENAKLKRINESLGINSKNIAIYEMENYDDFLLDNENCNECNDGEEITKDDEILNDKNEKNKNKMDEKLEKYLDFLKNKISNLQEEINNLKKEKTELSLSNNKINKLQENLKFIEDFLDFANNKNLTMIEEEFKEIENKINELEKEFNKFKFIELQIIEDYFELLSKKIQLNEIKLNSGLSEIEDLRNEINENYINNNSKYSNKNITIEKYLDYFSNEIKNELNKKITAEKYLDYFSYEIKNELNELINYCNFLGENLKNLIDYIETLNQNQEENKNTNNLVYVNNSSIEDLKNKINQMLETIKKKKETTEVKENDGFEKYFNNFTDEQKKQFMLLSTPKKQDFINLVLTKKPKTQEEIISIFKEILEPLTEEKIANYLLKYLPENLKERWDKLPEQEKRKILFVESQLYNLNSEYAIRNFWQTRRSLVNDYYINLDNNNLLLENENNNNSIQNTEKSEFFNELKRRLNKFY